MLIISWFSSLSSELRTMQLMMGLVCIFYKFSWPSAGEGV